MDNVYNTICHRTSPDEVLPGWIVGTAGAVRYRLPADVTGSTEHKTDVYGYLLGTVSLDGTIRFEFKQVNEPDVPESTRKDYRNEFIHSCLPAIRRRLCRQDQRARRSRETSSCGYAFVPLRTVGAV